MNNRLVRKMLVGAAALLFFLLIITFLPQQNQPTSISVTPTTPAASLPQSPGAFETPSIPAPAQANLVQSSGAIENAYRNRTRNLPVTETGIVTKILADDNKGSRHQRFVLRLQSGHTVLIAHNIDLAPRVNPLRQGDEITFSGRYEWNNQGGVVHWTHHDPSGRERGGYLLHDGRYYY